ncbi:MAG TPA: hypothetical protein PKC03_17650 [Dokdonella sp.]|jgi:hypothetical protein|nr:hypothetical protein [Dokdonella sp.]
MTSTTDPSAAAPPAAPAASPQSVPARDSLQSARPAQDLSGLHDFDYMVGRWHVRHQRTDPGRQDWKEFNGTSSTRTTMGGAGNVEDNVIELPSGTIRAMAVRAYDRETGLWAIWWIDGRRPHGKLDPPVKGRFENGIGRFHADDTIDGKPVRVRFTWTYAAPDRARWEQAFSSDAGQTWETNWIMEFTRT